MVQEECVESYTKKGDMYGYEWRVNEVTLRQHRGIYR